jgi:hypothetical protein
MGDRLVVVRSQLSQGKPTQRNTIMNTYEELKFRQGWTLAAKNGRKKSQKIAYLIILHRE